MTQVVFIDPVGGASGDMLLAALLDLGADRKAVLDAWQAVYPEHPLELDLDFVTRSGIRGAYLRVKLAGSGELPESVSCTNAELMARIARAQPAVREAARRVIDRLVAAEGHVHGAQAAAVELHELGSLDTLVDIVGVVAALSDLGVERLLVSALPIAVGGTLQGSHGTLPLPAPATLELLRGFAVRGVSGGELVTPTAAAIFAALGEPQDELPAMVIESVGTGAGSRDTPERPNVLRAILGRAASQPTRDAEERGMALLETNLDDLTPELVSDAADALRSAGALDVWTSVAYGKKGRLVIILSALCEPNAVSDVRRAFFETTTTLGVRQTAISRATLVRRLTAVSVAGGQVRIKRAELDSEELTATPEHDDVVKLALRTGRTVRSVYDEAKAAARVDDTPE